MISDDDVSKIAHLANLNLSAAEAKPMKNELNSILGFIEQLKEIDITGVEPTSHVHGSVNAFRDDQVTPHLAQKDALRNGPDLSGTFFRVPLVIAQEERNPGFY